MHQGSSARPLHAFLDQFHVGRRFYRDVDAQVTRSMFDKAMPHITRAIEQCHFYAFDLEMTGLHISDQRESWIDDMEDRYRVVRHCCLL